MNHQCSLGDFLRATIETKYAVLPEQQRERRMSLSDHHGHLRVTEMNAWLAGGIMILAIETSFIDHLEYLLMQ